MKYLLLLILLPAMAFPQGYSGTFTGGVRVETFTMQTKTYIGDFFYDSTIYVDCDVIDSTLGGTFHLSWTMTGDDSLSGIVAGVLLDLQNENGENFYRINIPNTYNVPSGEQMIYNVAVTNNKPMTFSLIAYDEIGNQSPVVGLNKTITPLYKQLRYEIDTSFVVLKTYPDTLKTPIGISCYNGLCIEQGFYNYKNVTTLHISAIRRKDISMNNVVDLTDLSGLIWYLTSGGH